MHSRPPLTSLVASPVKRVYGGTFIVIKSITVWAIALTECKSLYHLPRVSSQSFASRLLPLASSHAPEGSNDDGNTSSLLPGGLSRRNLLNAALDDRLALEQTSPAESHCSRLLHALLDDNRK